MKKILVYSWGGFTDAQLWKVLAREKIDHVKYTKPLSDYHRDMKAAEEVIRLIHQEKVEGIFSYNYLPLLSMIAQMLKIPYLSWVYDCPHYTLLSETVMNSWNYLFCFDAVQAEELRQKGVEHVFHFPLGVDVEDFEERIAAGNFSKEEGKAADIAFVGSFYNHEDNRLRHSKFSSYTTGYLDGILQAQSCVYGMNFIPQVLEEKVLREVVKVCRLQLPQGYVYGEEELAAGMINKEVTARERERILSAVASSHSLHVYTGSRVPDLVSQKEGFVFKGFADVQTQMPVIFHQSKINLNITLRSITSGIPQRVFDILACGGFCLTNYQPEIADFFEDGKELVMYSSIEDLLQKAKYYLNHEKERKTIACSGKEKVKKYFSLSLRLKMLKEMAEEDCRKRK